VEIDIYIIYSMLILLWRCKSIVHPAQPTCINGSRSLPEDFNHAQTSSQRKVQVRTHTIDLYQLLPASPRQKLYLHSPLPLASPSHLSTKNCQLRTLGHPSQSSLSQDNTKQKHNLNPTIIQPAALRSLQIIVYIQLGL
jgi:hypothetical protein